MKVKIDKEKCIACGTCAVLADKSFRIAEAGKVEVIEPIGDSEDKIREVIQSCPMGAIEIIEE